VTSPVDAPKPERALVVTAHPDDVDFGAGGTIAQWTRSGIEVTYCIITDGDAGGFDPDIPRSEIPRIRRDEQIAAAAVLGVSDVRYLGYRDGYLTASHDVRRDISRVIRQVRPERMLIQSPERNWERIPASHPDHLAAGEAAIFAIYPDARNPFAHTALLDDEGLEAWTVHDVWVMGAPTSNTYVDVSAEIDLKLAAILEHSSQVANPEEMSERVRGWLETIAQEGGLEDGTYAECFNVVHIF
jgi:LmbE family N-acetylglucosaminyl deacetylase